MTLNARWPGALLLMLLLSLLVAASPARAQAGPGGGCGPRPAATEVDLAAAFFGSPQGGHVWGRANVEQRPQEPGARGPILRVAYPRGSINPGNASAPQGGAGFELRLGARAERGCLSYRVRFPQGFRFAQGGKLPGLFGGDAPRGCSPEELSRGFSARLMWRSGGEGELYLYAPSRSTRCGESLQRGAWTFEPGAWTAIAEEVVMNKPGAADGAVRVWVNGRMAVDQQGLALRDRPEVGVEGLLFSTFFGGRDASWASPMAQYADFAEFAVSLGRPGR